MLYLCLNAITTVASKANKGAGCLGGVANISMLFSSAKFSVANDDVVMVAVCCKAHTYRLG